MATKMNKCPLSLKVLQIGNFFEISPSPTFGLIYHIVKLQSYSSLDGSVIASKVNKCHLSLKVLQIDNKCHLSLKVLQIDNFIMSTPPHYFCFFRRPPSSVRHLSCLVSAHFKEKYLSYVYQIWYGCLLG